MKKLSKLLCAVLSLMLVLSVSFAPALAETIGDAIEEQTLFTQLDKAWAELDVVQEDLVNSKADAKTVVKAIYDAAFECELIDEGSINEYREGIGFTFTVSGLACIYDYRVRVQSDKGYATPNEAVVEAIRTMPSDEDILLIGPYYGIDSSFTNQYKNEANSLAGYTGGNVTILQSSEATATAIVNNYLGKSVVIYDSHGTAGYGSSYLCLTTGTGITSEDLTNQWACSLGGGDYGIDGRYIQNHVNGDLGDCGVWMAICEGMKKSGNGVTGTALLQAGAGFVYGYSQSVTFAGDYKYEKTFWERMRQGDTVAQAFKVMTDTHGVCDPYGDAYPIVMSATDAFPSNPDSQQTVTSDWKLINNGTPDPSPSPTPTPVPDPEVPEGYALVKLTAGDVWGDGSGYQMLIDADATAYGTIIPVEGGLTNSGNAPAGLYDNFEYKIPENADGSLTTTNIIINNTGSVLVPAGTYDWAITNPTPGDRIWIASSNNSECPGRYDNYTFEAGKTYEFKVKLQGQNDWVDVVISDGGDTPDPTPTPGGDEDVLVGWYFESQSEVNEWTFVDKDGDGYNWDWNELGEAPVAYEGAGCIYSNSYVNYVGAVNPNNWAISPEFTIPANTASATLSWYAGPQDPDWVAEHYGVYVGTGTDTANYTQLFEETISYSDYKNTTVDLTAYAGQTIRVAFRHFNCTDMYMLKLDQVEVFATAGEEPVEEYTVTFVDGLTGETIDTQTVVAGEDAVAPEAPVHEGYTFVEWDTDFTNVQSDLTVTAVYAINEYTVTFVDGLTGETIDTQTVEHGADAVEPAVPEHVGYHFVEWDVDFTNVTSDLTVTALYEINTYNVHIRTTSCGTASPIGDIVVEHGDDLTINMTPDANHYVWYVAINGEIVAVRPGNVITINDITEDLDIYIVFNTDAPEVTPPTPAPAPSTPPKTGAISMTAIAIMAIVSGAGIMLFRKK